MIRPEFQVHRLNADGMHKAAQIAEMFTDLLLGLELVCGPVGREMAVVRTKLEEAAFFAKKAMASRSRYQEAPESMADVPRFDVPRFDRPPPEGMPESPPIPEAPAP